MHRRAKDLPHASKLPLLPVDNAHVRQDLDKVPWAEGYTVSARVTRPGRPRRVSPHEKGDLFMALNGEGGTDGGTAYVTRFDGVRVPAGE